MTSNMDSIGAALRVVDDTWAELRRAPGWGTPRLNECPAMVEVSHEAAERRAEVGRSLSARIAALGVAALPHDLALTVQMARVYADRWRREAEWYWTVFDPLGVGHFGLFAPTSYS